MLYFGLTEEGTLYISVYGCGGFFQVDVNYTSANQAIPDRINSFEQVSSIHSLVPMNITITSFSWSGINWTQPAVDFDLGYWFNSIGNLHRLQTDHLTFLQDD